MHFRFQEEPQVVTSKPTPVVAQVPEAAEVVGTRFASSASLGADDEELLWFPLALLLQPPRQKIQAGRVRTEQESTEGQTATCKASHGMTPRRV